MPNILYLGLNPPPYPNSANLIHYPVIRVVPRSSFDALIAAQFACLSHYTHFLFTSKSAVQVFFSFLNRLQPAFDFKQKYVIAIGKATALLLRQKGLSPLISAVSTQEGMIEMLERMSTKDASFFMPRSSLARPVLTDYFRYKEIPFTACDLYDTVFQKKDPVPDLSDIDEIVFTSPSTVDAFLQIFQFIPLDKKITVQGPITGKYLKKKAPLVENFCIHVSSMGRR
jgi:uroporphyrinogen-III synthase